MQRFSLKGLRGFTEAKILFKGTPGGLQKQIFTVKGLRGVYRCKDSLEGLRGFTEAKILFKGTPGGLQMQRLSLMDSGGLQ